MSAQPARPPEAGTAPQDEFRVLYNGECPICSREVGAYRRQAEAAGLDLGFDRLASPEGAAWGIDRDAAARRLHVRAEGRVLAGVDAFVALWARLPRWRWLARLVSLPGIRWVAGAVYEGLLAPLLYAMDRRRRASGRG
jgi:predicted DCC family thiol-disulfide oxidoreductase YuxK